MTKHWQPLETFPFKDNAGHVWYTGECVLNYQSPDFVFIFYPWGQIYGHSTTWNITLSSHKSQWFTPMYLQALVVATSYPEIFQRLWFWFYQCHPSAWYSQMRSEHQYTALVPRVFLQTGHNLYILPKEYLFLICDKNPTHWTIWKYIKI